MPLGGEGQPAMVYCEPGGERTGHPLARGQAQVGVQAGAQAWGQVGWGISLSYLSLKFFPLLFCVQFFGIWPYGGG